MARASPSAIGGRSSTAARTSSSVTMPAAWRASHTFDIVARSGRSDADGSNSTQFPRGNQIDSADSTRRAVGYNSVRHHVANSISGFE